MYSGRSVSEQSLAIIRRALVADALNVHAVLLAAKDDIPPRCPFENDHYRKWVRDKCRKRSVWVAEIGGDLAGIMVMDCTEMFYLATVAKFRRRGVGRALVRHALALIEWRGKSALTVEVWENNLPIISLLMEEGFRRHPNQPRRPHALVADLVPSRVSYFAGDIP